MEAKICKNYPTEIFAQMFMYLLIKMDFRI